MSFSVHHCTPLQVTGDTAVSQLHWQVMSAFSIRKSPHILDYPLIILKYVLNVSYHSLPLNGWTSPYYERYSSASEVSLAGMIPKWTIMPFYQFHVCDFALCTWICLKMKVYRSIWLFLINVIVLFTNTPLVSSLCNSQIYKFIFVQWYLLEYVWLEISHCQLLYI